MINGDVDPRVVGGRLSEARKARGMTQGQAAQHLGCSRPTLIAIEKGERPVKAAEIVELASLYGRSVHEIVRPNATLVALAPHLRAAIGAARSSQEIDKAIVELERFAEDYLALEKLLNARARVNYPPEVHLPQRGSLVDFAADAAMQERRRLGLGIQPITNLRDVLESDMSLRIFYGSLPSSIAGLYAHVAELGYCILINAKHPPERRRTTLAHEYGHFLCDRHKPGIDYLATSARRPANERFAESFGLSLLMPAAGVRRKFHEIVTTTGDFQVADLCRLSDFYFVAVQSMTLRLEEIGLIFRGSWEMLVEQGFQARKAAKQLGLTERPGAVERAYPERYKFLAVQAYQSGMISQGQLRRFLRCDPVTAREIVSECVNRSYVDEDGATRQGTLPFERSLLNTGS